MECIHQTHLPTLDNSLSPLNFLLASYLSDMAAHKSRQENLDIPSLLWVAMDVLNRATAAADNCLGIEGKGCVEIERTSCKFEYPVHLLKEISCKVGCKAVNEEYTTFFEETLGTIPKCLSDHTNSFAGKAVLILAAFALDYGELWLHFENFKLKKQFSTSLAFLRRVNDLNGRLDHESFKRVLVDLNDLVKKMMAFIKCIFEQERMENFISNLDRRNLPHLLDTESTIESNSNIAIQIVASCIFQVTYFSQERLILLKSMRGWISILEERTSKLETKQKKLQQYVEGTKIFTDLVTIFHSRDGVTKFIMKFIYCILHPQMVAGEFHPQMVCGGSEEKVSVDILKEKNIVLFISGLDIADNDIEDLKLFSEELKEHYKEYEIVWIPIVETVEKWGTEQKEKFEHLRQELPVYTVDQYRPFEGLIKFVKEQWHFSSKPLVLLIDQRGSVMYRGAFQIIKTVGIQAIVKDKTPPSADHAIIKIFTRYDKILQAIKEKKYIIFYGGTDIKWVKKFRIKLQELQQDVRVNQNIFVESLCIEEGRAHGDKDLIVQFWNGIQSLLYVSMQYWDSDLVSKEIQRLFSCKNETGWALLCKGSSISLSAHGKTIFTVVNDYSKWKGKLNEGQSFDVCIREYHNGVVEKTPIPCLHLEIKSFGKWLPEPISCPDCKLPIETVITYNCCHGKNKKTGYERVVEIFWDAVEILKATDPLANATIQRLSPHATLLLLLFAFVFVLVYVF